MNESPAHHRPFAERDWFRPVGVPSRYGIRATGRREPRDGLRIYSPQRKLSRVRFAVGRFPFVRRCVSRRDAPALPIDALLKAADIQADGAVAIQGSAPGRWVIGLEVADRMVAVAKLGPLSDDGLRHEASVLQTLELVDSWIRLPELLHAGEVADHFAVITRAAPPRSGRVSLDQVGELTTELTNGVLGVSWVHGDLAQWNTVRANGRVWILDWEQSRQARQPLWDLTDHLFREGVLVGRYSPRQVIQHLTGKNSVGWNHLVNVGEEPTRARDLVLVYLDGRPPLGKSAGLFEQRMRRCIK